MRHERERERKIDAIEAEVARQVKRFGIILVVLMILAVVALVLVVGHVLQVPWLSHSP
jgi:cell division septal protein FtsQ